MSVSCPKCFNLVGEDRKIGSQYFCECGWRFLPANDLSQPIYKDKSSLTIAAITAFLIASFMHGISWDSHFFSIIPLKVSSTMGTATSSDYLKMVEICKDRKKYDCVLESLNMAYALEPVENLEALNQRAKLLTQLERYEEASVDYKTYFKNDGKDHEARFLFAQSLRGQNLVNKATVQYEIALASKPDTLQITIAREFVEMLIETRQFAKAKTLIVKYQGKTKATKYFFMSELKEINKILSKARI